MASTPAERATARRRATLAVLSLAQFTTTLEFSIVYIALPSIIEDLRIGPAIAPWVVSAYAVLFAGFLVLGGRLTDRLGAKRVFVAAVVAFGAASAVGAAAAGPTLLLAARAAQGLAAAMLQPAVLGLIGSTFPAGSSRGRALAIWGSVGASGLAAGVILGGLLTTASWRLTFLINVPLTLLCALGAAAWLRSTREHAAAARIPLLASLLGTGAVLTLVTGLTLGVEAGWGAPVTLVCFCASLVLFLGFARNETTARDVLISRPLRRYRSLRIGSATTALYMASVGSEYYLLTLLLQAAWDYRPLQAGLAFLPVALLVTAGSAAAGRAVRRLGPVTVLIGGFATAAVGLLWLSLALHGDSYAVHLLPGLLLSGFGNGIVFTTMFVVGTHDVPPAHHGTAGALLTTSQYLASAVTVAVLALALGPSPDRADFRTAFLITTAAAAGGLLLGVAGRRQVTTRQ